MWLSVRVRTSDILVAAECDSFCVLVAVYEIKELGCFFAAECDSFCVLVAVYEIKELGCCYCCRM